ncbi:hypothetical protein SAMN05444272_1218 [Roseibium suaedae]|uniref:Uncharacterized protein n=1 Tax=Roseibium suaedae TaxID=735517 RepID=A0A1M7CMY7_9HYPH|nr:hypothetical protein SAMN05444272_1218 [Roseibium suaedae]
MIRPRMSRCSSEVTGGLPPDVTPDESEAEIRGPLIAGAEHI